jgi:hypothetical protein
MLQGNMDKINSENFLTLLSSLGKSKKLNKCTACLKVSFEGILKEQTEPRVLPVKIFSFFLKEDLITHCTGWDLPAPGIKQGN